MHASFWLSMNWTKSISNQYVPKLLLLLPCLQFHFMFFSMCSDSYDNLGAREAPNVQCVGSLSAWKILWGENLSSIMFICWAIDIVYFSPTLLKYCSQELLEAVEQERNMRANRSHSTALFRHPMLGDFEVWHASLFTFEDAFGKLSMFCSECTLVTCTSTNITISTFRFL